MMMIMIIIVIIINIIIIIIFVINNDTNININNTNHDINTNNTDNNNNNNNTNNDNTTTTTTTNNNNKTIITNKYDKIDDIIIIIVIIMTMMIIIISNIIIIIIIHIHIHIIIVIIVIISIGIIIIIIIIIVIIIIRMFEEHYSGDYSLALPKLNLQFLTIHDYLLRNFNLFRLESTYEIRGDLQDAVPRMKPSVDHEGVTQFHGRARMMMPLMGVEVMNVKRPKVGETVPSEVRAEIKICLTGVQQHIRNEWDQLREHDVIFLICIEAPDVPYEGKLQNLSVSEFPGAFGVKALRGAEAAGNRPTRDIYSEIILF